MKPEQIVCQIEGHQYETLYLARRPWFKRCHRCGKEVYLYGKKEDELNV